MPLPFFGKGLLIGFSIAAPVGPIGVLCIRRSLADGRRIGLATGLGAATADAAYGCVAGFSLTVASSFLVGHRSALALFGGLFLCYLGMRTFLSKPTEQGAKDAGGGWASAYFSTLLLTLSNPMTILSFAAVFAGFGLGSIPDYLTATMLVGGVFFGSALWWLVLSYSVSLFRARIGFAWMPTVNRISGCVIFAFGLYALSTSYLK